MIKVTECHDSTYSDQCKALSPKTVFLKSYILEKTKEIKTKALKEISAFYVQHRELQHRTESS